MKTLFSFPYQYEEMHQVLVKEYSREGEAFKVVIPDTAGNDNLCDWIDGLALEAVTLCEKDAGHIRPHAAENLFTAGIMAAEIAIGLDTPDALFSRAVKGMSPDLIGNLLLQIMGNAGDDQLNKSGKELALSVADILGPDHAQTLYRFAVLVTKLA